MFLLYFNLLRDASDLLQVQCAVGTPLCEVRAPVCISLGEKTRLQIIEEAPAQLRGTPAVRLAVQ